MAKYLKPQSPLQHQTGDYIYPITTADQIITDYGNRLNADMITVDMTDALDTEDVNFEYVTKAELEALRQELLQLINNQN